MCRQASHRPDEVGGCTRLQTLATKRRPFGHRRRHIPPAREGHRLNRLGLFRIRRAGRRSAFATPDAAMDRS